MTPENLYIHVPFCNGKCDYCAFYSEPEVNPEAANQWLKKIQQDSAAHTFSKPLETVYLGGGTPTALTPDVLQNCCNGSKPFLLLKMLRSQANVIPGHLPLKKQRFFPEQ